MFPYFEVLGKTVGSYAVCGFAGLFAAVFVAWRLSKKIGMCFEDVVLLTVSVSVGMLIGGHLLYAITNYQNAIKYIGEICDRAGNGTIEFSHIISALQTCFGGMVFYGGFIGALISLRIHIKASHLRCGQRFADVFAVCVPLFHAFGRIGCFLGGCCYGKPSDFGFIAHNDLLPEMSGVRRFPVSLFESAFCFLVFAVLLYLFEKKIKSGQLIYVYMAVYPVGRFILEFFRGDAIRGIFLSLSTSQWISIAVFVIGAYNRILRKNRQSCGVL